MAHELSTNQQGQIEMAYAGERPWHKLGTQVPGLMTTSEALKAAHLNWEVDKVPILSSLDLSPVPNHYTVVRKDTNQPLGVVGNRYTPISNAEAFKFFDAALGKGQGQIETIGALGQGERVWCLAQMPDTFEAIKGDPVERFLLCWTSHDGSKSMEVMFTSIRVVCNNTLNAALQGASHKFSIRHTVNFESKVNQAARMLYTSERYWEKMKEACQHLAHQSVTRVEVGMFLEAMFPSMNDDGTIKPRVPEGRSKVIRLMDEGRGANLPGVRGTKWGLYNAYTEYLDHESKIRKGVNRWERSIFGSVSRGRNDAMSLLLQ